MTDLVVAAPRTTAPAAALAILRRISAAGLAGVIAGLLVGGIGGRIVMRLTTILNPDAIGIRTENGALIGAITLDGTVALLLFGGLFSGLVAAVVWVVVSPWLPVAGRARLAVATIVAIGLGSPFLVQAFNRDFSILGSDVVIVAMLIGLVAAIGASVAWLADRLERRLPPADRPRAAAVYLLVVAAGAVVALVPTVSSFFSPEVCGCATTPSVMGLALVATGILTMVAWSLEIWRPPLPFALAWAGRVTVGVAVLAGYARTIDQARLILGV